MKQPPVVQGVAGGYTETRNPLAGVDGNPSGSSNHPFGNALRDSVFVSSAECAALGNENALINPELAQLIQSWSTLPPAIREAILAMLRAAE
tara:strand:+ start:1170 stop:1445 length:276 start_codon:yes stop_codon:yes gene_type:complete